jgi:hypothetical protein
VSEHRMQFGAHADVVPASFGFDDDDDHDDGIEFDSDDMSGSWMPAMQPSIALHGPKHGPKYVVANNANKANNNNGPATPTTIFVLDIR